MPAPTVTLRATGHASGASASVTSGTFTTTDTLVVVVFLGSTNCNTAFPITSVVWVSTPSGASAFTKRVGTNTPAGWQGVEIWTATTPSGTSGASVTATEGCNQGMQDINVYSVTGQNASPIGATGSASSDTSATVQCTVNGTAANSAIIVGWGQSNDGTTLTALANTSLQDSLSTAGGYDASGFVADTGAGGNVTCGSSVSDAFMTCVALEILTGASAAPSIGFAQQHTHLPGRGGANPIKSFRSVQAFLTPDPPAAPVFYPRTPPGGHGPMARTPAGLVRSGPWAYVVPAGGAVQYTQGLDGTLSMSGLLVKQTQKVFQGSMSSTGSLVKQTGKILAGSMAPSGAIVKQTQKPLSGSMASSGTLVKQTQKVLGGTLTSAGALVKQAQKVLAGALTSSGSLVKQTNKILAGTLTSSGALTAFKVSLISLAGTLTSSGTLVKQTGKNLAGTLTSAGTIVKLTMKGLAGTLVSTGALIAQKTATAVRRVFIMIFDD